MQPFFFCLGAAWVRSQTERPSVSKVNEQLHTIRMQIDKQINVQNELINEAKQITNYKLKKDAWKNRETCADKHIHCRDVMGYIPGTRWPG